MVKLRTGHMEKLGLERADLRDPFLRRFQRIVDPLVFDSPDWPLLRAGVDFRHAKTEYIGNHIGIVMDKFLSLKRSEADARTKVQLEAFPDTLIHRTQLANTLRYDLKKRLGKTGTDSVSLSEARNLLTEARVAIDRFDERLDRGRYLPSYLARVRLEAIPCLHFAGLIMANVLDSDPHEAHANRLVHNLRMQTTIIE